MRSVIRGSLFAIAALAVIAVCAGPALAQPGGRGGRGGRGGFGGFGGGGFGGGGGSTALLQDESVRTELDLVDEQITKLQEIAAKIREDVQASFQGIDFGSFRDLSEEERNARMAEIREKAEKVQAEGQKEIDAVLLPHQRERLKQLMVQSQLRFGPDRALSSGTLAEELGITDAQKEQLQAKQQEIETALREKIAKLQTEARDELFSVLTTEQQAKLKAMIGKPFTFTGGPGGPGGFGGGGFGGGGFGGRGGDGGGDGGRGGRGRGQRPDGNP
jgi:Spy/CpxP family protein refolding chaperone